MEKLYKALVCLISINDVTVFSKKLFVLLMLPFLILCSGCTMLNTKEEGPLIKYGNYCGKDHPKTPKKFVGENSDNREYMNWLLCQGQNSAGDCKKPMGDCKKPIDYIDFACQAHDVCYVLAGGPSSVCDDLLVKNIQAVKSKLIPVSSKGGLLSSRVVEGETGGSIDDCVWRCREIESFALSRIGSAGNSCYLDDWLKVILGPLVGAVVTTGDAVLVGPVTSNELCRCSEPISLFFPVTVEEYKIYQDAYDARYSFFRRLGLK